MLERLFPSDVVVIEAEEVSWQAALHPEEEAALGRVSEQRRRQFAAGRACAREALALLGLSVGALLRRPDRSPAWPEAAVGSISHCPGYCAAAVAPALRYAGLGLDVERAGRARPELAERICTGAERRRLAGIGGLDALGVTFSAKEAFYKAWHPLTGAQLGFQDVEIELEVEAGRFVARQLEPKAVESDTPLEGRFLVADGWVAAGIVLPRG